MGDVLRPFVGLICMLKNNRTPNPNYLLVYYFIPITLLSTLSQHKKKFKFYPPHAPTSFKDSPVSVFQASLPMEWTNVDYCPNCKKILSPDFAKRVLTCKACGYEEPLKQAKFFREELPKSKPVLVIKNTNRIMKGHCPNCGNDQVYSWRAGISKENAPEPSNRFYKCVKCGHKWKEM